MNLKAGYAVVDFTPEPGLPLLGQMHPRIATHARDSLQVCAAAFEGNGEAAVVAAADVCVLDNAFVEATQQKWAARSGLPPRSLLIHATHTHVAPVSTGALMEEPLPQFEEALRGSILQAAEQAWNAREEVQVFADTGYLEQLGWNRRVMFEDGTTRMYASTREPGYIGLEGPRDGAVPALWTRNARGEITGVITGFATHPNCLESETFYSADLPGETRKHLAAALGGVPVVYLTGAAGNTAPSVLEQPGKVAAWRGETGVVRSGQLLAGEILKLIAGCDEAMPEPTLALAHTELRVPLREWPVRDAPSYPLPLVDEAWLSARHYYSNAQDNWPQRVAGKSPLALNLNVLRIGDFAISTNPAELFVEFGLAIKEASPARVNLISELTDGYCGYVPTGKAFARGGYETWCAPSSQLSFDAGERIVDATKELLRQTFAE